MRDDKALELWVYIVFSCELKIVISNVLETFYSKAIRIMNDGKVYAISIQHLFLFRTSLCHPLTFVLSIKKTQKFQRKI